MNLGAQGITLQTEGNPTLHSQYGDLALLQQAVTSCLCPPICHPAACLLGKVSTAHEQ